jgi:hypothetical protein
VLIRRAWHQPRLLISVNVLWLNARLTRRWIYREVPLAHSLRQIVGSYGLRGETGSSRFVYSRSPLRSRFGAGVGRSRPVALVVKRYARATGLTFASFSGHSLRAGFVTSAARAGERRSASCGRLVTRASRWCCGTCASRTRSRITRHWHWGL